MLVGGPYNEYLGIRHLRSHGKKPKVLAHAVAVSNLAWGFGGVARPPVAPLWSTEAQKVLQIDKRSVNLRQIFCIEDHQRQTCFHSFCLF